MQRGLGLICFLLVSTLFFSEGDGKSQSSFSNGFTPFRCAFMAFQIIKEMLII